MGISVRSHLIAGVAVFAVGVIAIPSAVPTSTPMAKTATTSSTQDSQPTVEQAPTIDLAALVRSFVTSTPNPAHFAAAKAAIERIDPAAAAVASTRQAAVSSAVAAAVPAPLNAASDAINSGYQFIQYWVDYGVQLTNYVLQFIPYGYLISGQVNILYYNLIRPIADSVVYGLIDPVVNDPLNPASYVNGLITVGQTTVNAAINTGIAEFNYFFGWLIPPLPPLPLAVTVAKTVDPDGVASPSTADLESASPLAAKVAAEPTEPQKEQLEPTVVKAGLPDTPIDTHTDTVQQYESPADSTVQPTEPSDGAVTKTVTVPVDQTVPATPTSPADDDTAGAKMPETSVEDGGDSGANQAGANDATDTAKKPHETGLPETKHAQMKPGRDQSEKKPSEDAGPATSSEKTSTEKTSAHKTSADKTSADKND